MPRAHGYCHEFTGPEGTIGLDVQSQRDSIAAYDRLPFFHSAAEPQATRCLFPGLACGKTEVAILFRPCRDSTA